MSIAQLSGRVAVAALLMAVAGATGSIWLKANAAPQSPGQFVPLSISINALMVEMIDHSAHEIWEAGNRSTALTGREWLTVEQHAIQLQAGATLTSLGGTGQADRGWAVSPAWQEWSRKLRDVAANAKSASDSKNQMALRSAGDTLVTVCEGCHDQFKPDVPTEGILHVPH